MEKTKELMYEANTFFETLSENIVTKEEKSEWFMVSTHFIFNV